ncbi:MAG: hypothetical protein H6510_02745 [Acidobacteria bacterium]|nr:hypothetical protein [Acidobacteriota bacterium]MCB9396714.1 hypothetical protein [Acidobacteriota bacterium]
MVGLWLVLSCSWLYSDRVVHVLVPLCDNANQGIVPVSASLGNGRDLRNNLYWGALYGMKTHLLRRPRVTKISDQRFEDGPLAERLVLKWGENWVVLDAYWGDHMEACLQSLFDYAGGKVETISLPSGSALQAGGNSDFLVFSGHNGLLDIGSDQFSFRTRTAPKPIQVAVFACLSKSRFLSLFEEIGVQPAVLTNGLMAPEGYVTAGFLEAVLDKKGTPREQVAQAYAHYQKCKLQAARNLFWSP